MRARPSRATCWLAAAPVTLALLLTACGEADAPAPHSSGTASVAPEVQGADDDGLTTIPRAGVEQHTPALASSLAARKVSGDDWTSESLAQRADEHLRELQSFLLGSTDALPAEWIDAQVRANALWWPDPEAVAETSQLRVRRPAAPTAEPSSGRAQFLAALRELRGDERGARLDDVHFKLIGVEQRADGLDLRALFEARGSGNGRALGQRATWDLHWLVDPDDSRLRLGALEVSAFEEVLARADGTLFGEISGAALGSTRAWTDQLSQGLESWSGRLDRSLGVSLIGHHGLALGDVDEDGLEDLYAPQVAGLPNLLFLRRPDGTAVERAGQAAVDYLDNSRAALLLDLDGDDHLDLAVELDPLFVLHAGNGAAHFESRLQLQAPASASLSAADFDLDGDLDLYLCGYQEPDQRASSPLPYHDAQNGKPNRMLRNDCGPAGWAFADVTAEVGLDQNNRCFSLAASWEDYDNDGDADLYVANEFGRNNLYRNDGGHFSDVAAEAGVEDMAAGMGVTWADYDRDGDLDLYVSSMFSSAGQRVTYQGRFKPGDRPDVRAAYQRHARGNSLFENLGDGRFSDVSEAAGVTHGRWAWGSLFCDLDGDGWRDLFVPNGFVTGCDPEDLCSFFWRQVVSRSPTRNSGSGLEAYEAGWLAIYTLMRAGLSWSGHERNCAFLNTRDGRFADVSPVSGLDGIDDARAALRVDWDQDGAPDLVFSTRTAPMLRILRNRSSAQWLALRLRGARGNRDGIGARIELQLSDGSLLVDSVRAGEGYLAQSSPWTHFGLDAGAVVAGLRVRWPAGAWEVFQDCPGPGRFVLEQGLGRALPERPAAECVLVEAPVVAQPAGGAGRLVLAAPLPTPVLHARTRDGAALALWDEARVAPCLVLLWADWSAPCMAELSTFAAAQARIARSGLRVLALDVDPAAASSRLAQLQWPFLAAEASPELLDVLDALQRSLLERGRPLALPTSLLFDAEGRLAVIYRGSPQVDVLLADLDLLGAAPEERRAAAVPFPGRWLAALPSPDLERAARLLTIAGQPDVARFFEILQYESLQTSPGRIQFEFGNARARAGQVAAAVEHFRAATELEPGFQVAWTSLATALQSVGRIDAAIAAYRQALDLDARDAAARYNLALALYGLQRSVEGDQQLEVLRLVDRAQAEELEAALLRLGLR